MFRHFELWAQRKRGYNYFIKCLIMNVCKVLGDFKPFLFNIFCRSLWFCSHCIKGAWKAIRNCPERKWNGTVYLDFPFCKNGLGHAWACGPWALAASTSLSSPWPQWSTRSKDCKWTVSYIRVISYHVTKFRKGSPSDRKDRLPDSEKWGNKTGINEKKIG